MSRNDYQKQILEKLQNLSEDKYRIFASKLNPGCNLLGVRLPVIRKFAKQIIKDDHCLSYIAPLPTDAYFEEKFCKAILIARYKNIDEQQRLSYLKSFVEELDGWAICDSLCSELKVAKLQSLSTTYYNFVKQCYTRKDKPYIIRFACVMTLMYFYTDNYFDEIFSFIESIDTEHYYVHMGVAWLISKLYTQNKALTLSKLHSCRLDTKTYNKSLQKIVESNTTDIDEKNYIRSLKKK